VCLERLSLGLFSIPYEKLDNPNSEYLMDVQLLKDYQQRLEREKPCWEEEVRNYPKRRGEMLAMNMVERVITQYPSYFTKKGTKEDISAEVIRSNLTVEFDKMFAKAEKMTSAGIQEPVV
jgi:hypothetical protein